MIRAYVTHAVSAESSGKGTADGGGGGGGESK